MPSPQPTQQALFADIKVGDQVAVGDAIEAVTSVSPKRFKTDDGEYQKADGHGLKRSGRAEILTPELKTKIEEIMLRKTLCKEISDASFFIDQNKSAFYSAWSRETYHRKADIQKLQQLRDSIVLAKQTMKEILEADRV